MTIYCSRCGREQKEDSQPSAIIMELRFLENEITIGGVCIVCMDTDNDLSYLAIPKEERNFGGWFMDMETDDERTWFIRKRIELYGS